MRALLILCFVLSFPTIASPQASVEAARSFRSREGPRILAEFAALLRVPNVSSDLENVRANAELIREWLARRGADVRVIGVDGAAPVVVGELTSPDAKRTLGIYVHYDGQPVQEELWTHPPFEPVLTTGSLEDGAVARPFPEAGERIDPEWRIYARGAGDDKAPIPALLAAIDALDEANLPRTARLVFLFEGEEEAGSPHLGRYLELLREELRVDLWLICDGPLHQSRRPQLVFGVRGVTGLEITIYGAARSLHSGHYGNWAPNPGMHLAHLLASMRDPEGHVLVEGFYDSVAPLSPSERAAIERLPAVDETLKLELGLAWTEGGEPLAERLLLPSLNVRGLESAAVGKRAKNVIPSTATAALDIRLVKGNDPVHMIELVEEHVAREGYLVVREDPDLETRRKHARIARITRQDGYVAVRTSMDLPLVPALAAAAENAAGEPALLVPSLGGSLPLFLFEEILGTPLVILPIANHDDNQHAPDENLRIANLWYGIDLFAGILTLP